MATSKISSNLTAIAKEIEGKGDKRFGTCVADFKVLSELGRGSYGIVYKVQSKIDGDIYVLKKISMKHMKVKHQKEALQEVMILRKLMHPHIIRYYSSFIEEDCLYIVMEYAGGGDLYALLKKQREKKKFFAEKELWTLAYEMVLGVEYLHSHNIIHRDLKCLNIFLSQHHHVKIGDLGVSKIVSSTTALHGTRVGTPLYLSPELVKQQPYDFKVDIWAIGCVLFHLACLEPPFSGDNLISLGNNIVNKNPKSLPSVYSGRFLKFVQKFLSKKPNERPTTKDLIRKFPSFLKKESLETIEDNDNPERKVQASSKSVDHIVKSPPPPSGPTIQQPSSKKGELRTKVRIFNSDEKNQLFSPKIYEIQGFDNISKKNTQRKKEPPSRNEPEVEKPKSETSLGHPHEKKKEDRPGRYKFKKIPESEHIKVMNSKYQKLIIENWKDDFDDSKEEWVQQQDNKNPKPMNDSSYAVSTVDNQPKFKPNDASSKDHSNDSTISVKQIKNPHNKPEGSPEKKLIHLNNFMKNPGLNEIKESKEEKDEGKTGMGQIQPEGLIRLQQIISSPKGAKPPITHSYAKAQTNAENSNQNPKPNVHMLRNYGMPQSKLRPMSAYNAQENRPRFASRLQQPNYPNLIGLLQEKGLADEQGFINAKSHQDLPELKNPPTFGFQPPLTRASTANQPNRKMNFYSQKDLKEPIKTKNNYLFQGINDSDLLPKEEEKFFFQDEQDFIQEDNDISGIQNKDNMFIPHEPFEKLDQNKQIFSNPLSVGDLLGRPQSAHPLILSQFRNNKGRYDDGNGNEKGITSNRNIDPSNEFPKKPWTSAGKKRGENNSVNTSNLLGSSRKEEKKTSLKSLEMKYNKRFQQPVLLSPKASKKKSLGESKHINLPIEKSGLNVIYESANPSFQKSSNLNNNNFFNAPYQRTQGGSSIRSLQERSGSLIQEAGVPKAPLHDSQLLLQKNSDSDIMNFYGPVAHKNQKYLEEESARNIKEALVQKPNNMRNMPIVTSLNSGSQIRQKRNLLPSKSPDLSIVGNYYGNSNQRTIYNVIPSKQTQKIQKRLTIKDLS